jgi:hypothetical protein
MIRHVCKIPESSLDQFTKEMVEIQNIIAEVNPYLNEQGILLVHVVAPDKCPSCARPL